MTSVRISGTRSVCLLPVAPGHSADAKIRGGGQRSRRKLPLVTGAYEGAGREGAEGAETETEEGRGG